MTNPQQYVLPPESVVDIAFKRASVDYNLHINTYTGLISLYTIENGESHTDTPVFIKSLS